MKEEEDAAAVTDVIEPARSIGRCFCENIGLADEDALCI